MRIGMFADMYKPHLSGVTNYIDLYKRRFEELGHEVWVFTFGNTEYPDDEPNVLRSPAISWGDTGWEMGLVLCSEAKQVIPTLDVAHVHHPFVSGRVALKHCGEANVPVVFTNHTRYDLYSDTYAWFVPKTMRYAYIKRYLNEFAHDVDLVICPSEGIQRWLSEFGVTDETVLLSNCVDIEPFCCPDAPYDRSRYGFPKESVVFCYLGRVSDEKNMGLLVRAFIRAAASDDRICLLVLGDGNARTASEKAIADAGLADRAHFEGLTPYDEVPNHLAAADVFATASVSEVHPLVIMEGFAAGLPAIGIVSPGVGDIIEDGLTGFLTPEDSGAFAERMVQISADDELRERLADSARTTAERYDIRIMAEEMLGHYRTLIESHRSDVTEPPRRRWVTSRP